ncbi:MAG: peptidylprolyl isomerase [Aeromicrobium sp.]|nr:peptidylprolyl isomerase [Aeromicrobium sp.]
MSGLVPLPPATDGQAPGGYQAYPRHEGMDQGRAPGSKTTAIWALVLSIIPMPLAWVASVVLSIIVLRDSKHSRDNGKGMAISALIIVPVWIVVLILLVVASGDLANRDSSGTVTSQGDIAATSLLPGDCLVNDPSTKAQLTVKVGPCEEPHMQEAFANFNLPDGDYPGDKQISRLSGGGCIKRFSAYLGTSLSKADPGLRIFFLHPVSSSWSRTKKVTCLVGTGASTTGSLKGSGASTS